MVTENQKKYFHNSKTFLKKFHHIFPKFTEQNFTTWHELGHIPKNFYINNNEKFYSNSICSVYDYTFKDGRIKCSDSANDLPAQELHLQRQKNKCLIVLGNELLYGDKNLTLEDRLEKSFATHCAKKLDSDLFLSTFENIDNTSLFIRLIDILSLLKKNNYKEIKIIFQLSDCARCFDSEFWSKYYINDENIKKCKKSHMSYHFLSPYQFIFFLNYEWIKSTDDVLEFYKDANFLSNTPIELSYFDFFEIYESAFLELFSTLSKMYTDYDSIKYIVWKDFHPVSCDKIVKKTLAEFSQETLFSNDEKLDLPYTFSTIWFEDFYRSGILLDIFFKQEIEKQLYLKLWVKSDINSDYFSDEIDSKYQPHFWDKTREEFYYYPIKSDYWKVFNKFKSLFDSDLKSNIMKEKFKIEKLTSFLQNKFPKIQTSPNWGDYLLEQSGWIK